MSLISAGSISLDSTFKLSLAEIMWLFYSMYGGDIALVKLGKDTKILKCKRYQ